MPVPTKKRCGSDIRTCPKEYIKDLTEITVDIKEALIDEENFRQILQIKLMENNKENVLNVIRQLEKIEGIKYAGPNYAYYAAITTPNILIMEANGAWQKLTHLRHGISHKAQVL